MIIAIHDRAGSFSDRWIAYCDAHGIPFRRVDCHAGNIIGQVRDADALMWHWDENDPAEGLIARQIIAAVESMGIPVFPSTRTCWHYDDKLGQKYLLEAIGAPMIESHAFYNLQKALCWIETVAFPKVFKLRCCAASSNVTLVRTRREAEHLCRTAFGRGLAPTTGYFADSRVKVRRIRSFRQLAEKLCRMPAVMRSVRARGRLLPIQKGYVLFQDFLSGHECDTRVTVIGNRAFAYRRRNRPGDFRASGSGVLDYDRDRIDLRCVRIALDTAGTIGSQSLAFDFLFDADKQPRIVEISYCYVSSFVHQCDGWWGSDLAWHPGHFWPEDLVIEDLLTPGDVPPACPVAASGGATPASQLL